MTERTDAIRALIAKFQDFRTFSQREADDARPRRWKAEFASREAEVGVFNVVIAELDALLTAQPPQSVRESERDLLVAKLSDTMDPDGARDFVDRVIQEAMIATFLTAQPAEGWQPIATAPKDGLEVLVHDEGAVMIAYWDEEVSAWIDNGEMRPPPQHWMPLPDPPKEPRP